MKQAKRFLVLFVVLLLGAQMAWAAIPGLMNYQAKLTDLAGNPVTVSKAFQFKIYDALTGGSLIWTSGTYTITPDSNGIFSAPLGSAGDTISFETFSSATRYMEMIVAGEILSPRTQLVTSSYAFKSAVADSISGTLGVANGGTGITTVTTTEFGYLSGVTSAIQTQLDSKSTSTLADGKIFVGNGSNIATGVNMSGDVTISNTGTTTIGTGKVDLAGNKVTGTLPVAQGGTGITNVTTPEFGYLSGVTSAIQTQFNSKSTSTLASGKIFVGNGSNVATGVDMGGDITIDNAGTTTIGAGKVDLAGSKVTGTLPVANGGTGITNVTTPEFGYLSGVTSGIQTQLSNKAASGANSDITSLSGLTTPLSVAQGGTGATTSGDARTALGGAKSGANSDITSLTGLTTPLSTAEGGTGITTVTTTEFGYLSGVTSAIQTQLDNKSTSTLASGRIFVGNGSNVATAVAMTGNVTIDSTGRTYVANLPLADGKIYIGNESGVATAQTFSGDVTVTNTGVTTIGATKVTNAMLAGSIDLTSKVTGALAIDNGGTGSITAPLARIALSAAGRGANSDITSLTGLTTPLSVAQGGTGATSAAGLAYTLEVYTSSGTWTKPAGLGFIIVECVGGGGGGGGVGVSGSKAAGGGGGGGGGYVKQRFNAADLSDTENYAVGGGGGGGDATPNNGTTGTTSSFGTDIDITAAGGTGGSAMVATATGSAVQGGAGGTGTGGVLNVTGGPGGYGLGLYQVAVGASGAGGNSVFGGGGASSIRTTAGAIAGSVGNAYGGGGSGAAAYNSVAGASGAAGATGVVIIYGYK